MTDHERVVYAKLEAIKEIRSKTIQLEKLKAKLIMEIDSQDQEEKCLAEYKQEMELLLQEKMSHVEELRQIHADINAMEGVIKQAEESRIRSLNAANRLHEEYLPLKLEIDRLRRECLGLGRLPEIHEEEAPPLPHSFLVPPNPLRLVTNKHEQARPSSIAATSHPGPPAPTFRSDFVNMRQQPPPMKSCLSCHQQIHRNAPICPLCKAKSRSRNPKKPKKK
ncbi:zinc finger c4h2 domain-containing protein [Holotrichia oblita]|uniref:Zinc finger c4h2 domain-containing protein n=1 Tax=Holotrichia oblita TaxID=644536 RepID=A0ACB9SVV2_HOLOL|nr:zinc finger c4h2 domain-containing protein [Holotrichia oblita]